MFIRSSSLAADLGMTMSPFLLEHPGHRTGFTHVAAVLAEGVADFADRAIAVIGGDFDQDGHAAGAVAFEGDLFVGNARQLAGTALDGALDVVGGHVLGLSRGHGGAQPGILFRIAAASWRPWLISLMRRVKILPRLASSAPFLCLIVAHLEWPDMRTSPVYEFSFAN